MGELSLIGVKSMDYVGKLLVAPPSQEDEFWSQSVVFIYEESGGAHIGLALNKPSDRTVKELAEHHDLEYDGDEVINIGGPVNPSALVMLHTDDWTCTNTMQIKGGLRISSDRTMLKRICNGDTPKKWKFFLGMCGWSPGQLEKEARGLSPYPKKNAWLVAPALNDVVFEQHTEKMWKTAISLAVHEATESFFTID